MNKEIEDIKAIREMMEKSTKFLSLSGLTGIIAGFTAIIGSAFAYFYLLRDPSLTDFTYNQEVLIILADAFVVLAISIGSGIYFSGKKAKKNKQKLFNSVTRRAIYDLALPLIAGGIFSFIFLVRGDIAIVASTTLLFYGMALLNVSKYTFEETHYLGITEIVLGLLAAVFMYNGILFWAIGFGVCHIIYGFALYNKYDKKK
jgi:predicted lysophospholipase L1 biosynthesis ABC-type transport system permease subunit